MRSEETRVLLVDDDEDDFFIIRDLASEFKQQRIKLEWAATYDEAVQAINAGHHQAYLIDYRLGSRTGIDLIKEATRIGVVAPLILLTGQGDQEVDQLAMSVGAADYLVKNQISSQLLERSIRYSLYRAKTLESLRIKEAQERLASVGLLASSLAHEIGNPLGIIRGRAEYVSQQFPDAQIQKNTQIIIEQIDRVSKLIHSLLNLARGDETANVEKIALQPIVSDVLTLMAHEFDKNGISVQNEISADARIQVRGEAQPLHQVVLNLLLNAVHAIQAALKTDKNKKHHIRIFTQEDSKHCILSIEDTGCGISEENKKHLFKPFYTTKEIGIGTGLGLVTSFKIVQSWGGTISFESKEGLGTTFRVFLPKDRG